MKRTMSFLLILISLVGLSSCIFNRDTKWTVLLSILCYCDMTLRKLVFVALLQIECICEAKDIRELAHKGGMHIAFAMIIVF